MADRENRTRTGTEATSARASYRRLPWTDPVGKTCYLSTDNPYGLLSVLADGIEAEHIRDGAQVANGANAVLDDPQAGEYAVRAALKSATQALHTVVRVAELRGERLNIPEWPLNDPDDAEPLPGTNG